MENFNKLAIYIELSTCTIPLEPHIPAFSKTCFYGNKSISLD